MLEPGKIKCHLEKSRASSLVTRAIYGSAARVGVGKVSLCSDLIGDRPTLVRGDISINVFNVCHMCCYQCSDSTNWGIYFGYCYWDRDGILYAKQVADSGPGSPSDLVLLSWETAA